MADVNVWYWEYSLVFPLSLMIVLLCFYCCRILCLRSVVQDDRRRQMQQVRRNQQRQNQQPANVSQVYTISTVVVSDPIPPYTQKTPDLVDDLPPSYDEAIILAKEVSASTPQQNPVSLT